MPEQFLVRYDYEFMFALRKTLIKFRKTAPKTENIIAHRVIDELVLYLIQEEAEPFIEEMELNLDTDAEDDFTDGRGWAFDIFDDMDIVYYLYSALEPLQPDDTYHFDNWFKEQFYVQEDEDLEEEGNAAKKES